MKKVENLIWGAVFIVIGLVLGLNALGVTNIDIFFDGWWSLFIIVPSVVSIIKNYKDVSAYIWLAIGIALLLSAQGILDMSVIGKLILPAVLVAIGVGIIFKDTVSSRVNEKIDELNKITDATLTYEVKDNYVYLTLTKNYKTITPGLSKVLGKPYKIKSERVILSE